MHSEILSQQQQELLPLLQHFGKEFGLVGGTAIALQIGHRRSIDFDLFQLQPFAAPGIRSRIHDRGWEIEHTLIQGEHELSVLVNQVRLTFYYFPYPITFSKDFQGMIGVPDLLTLAAMKTFALGKRAKWKDYVDLYFLFQHVSFTTVVKKAEALFSNEFNQKLLRVQLGYFGDIDYTEEVEFMNGFEVSQSEVQRYLENISLE